jgi:hypothetical protein
MTLIFNDIFSYDSTPFHPCARSYTANRIANGDVPADLVEYIRGRNYVRRSNLPAFAEALGLQLKQPHRPARARPSSRRSAA